MDIISLKQERARLVASMQAIVTSAKGEGRSLTAEERSEFDNTEAQARDLGKDIERMESLRSLSSMDSVSSREAGIEGRDLTGAPVDSVARTDEYRTAFEAYIRRGLSEMTPEQVTALRAGEQRTDMLTSAATNGGYVVPTDFAKIVISAKVPGVALRRTRATIFNTSNGQDLPVPVQSAYGVADYLTEGSAATSVADTGSKVTLKAFTAVRSTAVSFQLMQDSAFDMSGLLGRNIGASFAQFEDAEFIAGAGTTAVTGVKGATAGHTTATGSTSTFTYADVLAWYYSVAPQYRGVGEFVLADDAMATLAGLVDDNSRPIWTASIIPGEPDSLMGRPLYTSVNFDAAAAGKVAGVFGDFSNGYGIRDVGGLEIRRSDERLVDQLETLFVAWERIDGNLLDASALRAIKYAAS